MFTPKVDEIGKLDLRPEDEVHEFATSQEQNKTYVKPPNWDSSGDSLELLYLTNLQENAAHLRLQTNLMKHGELQKERSRHRTEKALKMWTDLRKRFIEVNQFTKECLDKRSLAEKIINVEMNAQELMKKHLVDFVKMRTDLKKFKKVMRNTVEQFEPYERIIQEVVNSSNIYESMKDCMDRCDALMLAQCEINNLGRVKVGEIENMRQRIVKFTNDAASTVMGLQTSLLEVTRSYENANVRVSKWEKLYGAAQQEVANVTKEKGAAVDGINDLFKVLIKRQMRRKVPESNTVESRLDYIKSETELLNQIVETCYLEKRAKSELKHADKCLIKEVETEM